MTLDPVAIYIIKMTTLPLGFLAGYLVVGMIMTAFNWTKEEN